MDFRIQIVIQFMQENLSHALSLEKLATAVNLSPSRLSHIFKAETGLSPAQYWKSLRLREAANLLTNSFLRVQEITQRVGIQDESHFHRDFKKTFGLTPLQFRARHHLTSPRLVAVKAISATKQQD
jgi:AraC family transcriptional regulator of arabinose operon